MTCCLPDAPGYCPGPANCPLMQSDPPEPRQVKPDAKIDIAYVEFSGSELTYAEWTEDGEPFYAHEVPPEIRANLAQKLLKS